MADINTQILIDGLVQHWGISPKACLMGLPDTGVSVARWQHPNKRGDYHSRNLRYGHYLLSLILRPMQAQAWAERRQVWSGPIAPNSVRIVHEEHESSWHSTSPFDLLHIMIPRTTFSSILGKEIDQTSRILFDDPLYRQDEMVCQIGRRIVQIMSRPGPFTATMADGLCKTLVAHLLDRYAVGPFDRKSPAMGQNQMRRVLELIHDNLTKDITVAHMAKVAGMSEFHFARQFRLAMGQTPHQFLLNTRTEYAKELLTSTHRNILEIALDCGFKDASHFSRVFRTLVGVTPSQYRRMN